MPGLVIGKVAIKVLPDTDGFREKVKRDLNGKEKPGQVKVKVIPELDDTAFRNIQRQLAGLSDIDVRVSPELDRADWSEVQVALEGIEQIEVDVDPMLDWAQYTRALEALEELSEPQLVEVGVWARISSFKATAARLAALTRPRIVEIKTALDEPRVQKTAKLLGDAFSRLSGLRFTLDQFAKFRQEMLNLDRLLPKIGLFSNGLGSLSAIALTAGGSLLSVSAGLIQMGAAGLALPGLLGGIGVGAALTATAFAAIGDEAPALVGWFRGLKDVIQGAFWANAAEPFERLGEALASVNPLISKTSGLIGTFWGKFADDIRKSLLPELPEMFANLDKSIQIFTRSTGSVANIIATLGKLGSKYLPQLAEGFADLTDNFSDWLTAADEAGKLTEWVDAGIEQIKNLGRAVGATASIFYSLTQAAQAAGGESLAGVADGLERIAAAAASPGFQRGLTDTLRAAYEMMDQISNRVGPSLANLIESLSETFQEMAPVMGDTVATAVTAIADALASPALQKGLSRLLSGFNRMVNKLAPAMQPLADKLGALGGVVGELAEAVGSVLGQAIITISPLFVALAEAILPLIDGLGEILSGVLRDLQPVFSQLAAVIRDEVAPLIPPLVESFKRLWSELGPVLIPILEKLVPLLGEMLVVAITSMTDAWNILADGIAKAVEIYTATDTWLKNLDKTLRDVGKSITDFFSDMPKNIAAAWESIKSNTAAKWSQIKTDVTNKANQLRTQAVTAIENLRANVSQKWDSIRSAASAKWAQLKSDVVGKAAQLRSEVVNAIENLRANASAKWESIRSNASAKWESIKNTISNAAGRIREAVSSKVDGVVSYMRGVPSRIVGALGNLGSLLYSAGAAVIDGLISGIRSKISSLVGVLNGITSLIPGEKGPIEKDRKLLTPAGIAIMQGLIKGIESEEDALIRMLHGVSDNIVDTLGTDVATTVSADAVVTTAQMARQITTATRSSDSSDTSTPPEVPLQIGNITIPLEDLKQLRDLEDFMELLRVRSRMG